MLAWRHEDDIDTYDRYCGYACLATAVDIDATRDAFTALIKEPEQRRRMGAAARQHAIRTYDWSVIIHSYQELWQELGARRAGTAEVAPRGTAPATPWRADPFDLFASYPSEIFDRATVLERAPERREGYTRTVSRLAINGFGGHLVGPNQPAQDIVNRLVAAGGSMTVGALLDSAAPAEHPRVWLAIGWLLKMGLLRVSKAIAANC